LSEMLSIMIVLWISLPSKLKSFTKNGPFWDVCCL
jgi:nicotinamide riboside transporter PnuC